MTKAEIEAIAKEIRKQTNENCIHKWERAGGVNTNLELYFNGTNVLSVDKSNKYKR